MDIVPKLTEEHLHAIDRIIAEGKPTFCAMTHPDVDQFDPAIRAEGFVGYAALPDFRSRRPYERSLWCWRQDGRSVPELYLLASLKFGVLSPDVTARWSDGQASNKTQENVSLVNVTRAGVDGRVAGNKYGVQAGTPEYRKKYYSDPENKKRQREHAKKNAAKRRMILRLAKDLSEPTKLAELSKRILGPDGRKGDEDDRTFAKLADPAVQEEILTQARMLHEVMGLSEEDALRQARDNALGLSSTTVASESSSETTENT